MLCHVHSVIYPAGGLRSCKWSHQSPAVCPEPRNSPQRAFLTTHEASAVARIRERDATACHLHGLFQNSEKWPVCLNKSYRPASGRAAGPDIKSMVVSSSSLNPCGHERVATFIWKLCHGHVDSVGCLSKHQPGSLGEFHEAA